MILHGLPLLLMTLGSCRGFKITAEASQSPTTGITSPLMTSTTTITAATTPTTTTTNLSSSSSTLHPKDTSMKPSGAITTTSVIANSTLSNNDSSTSTRTTVHIPAPAKGTESNLTSGMESLNLAENKESKDDGEVHEQTTVRINSSTTVRDQKMSEEEKREAVTEKTPETETEADDSQRRNALEGRSADLDRSVYTDAHKEQLRDGRNESLDTNIVYKGENKVDAKQHTALDNTTKPEIRVENESKPKNNSLTTNDTVVQKVEITAPPSKDKVRATISKSEIPEPDAPKPEAFRAQPDREFETGHDNVTIYGLSNPDEHVHTDVPHRHQVANSHEQEDPFFRCPQESGFFRHPRDCSRFYRCHESKPVAMFCSEGTAFDPATSVCSWAVGRDGCGAGLRAAGTPRRSLHRHARDVTVQEDAAMDMDDVASTDAEEVIRESAFLERLSREVGGGTPRADVSADDISPQTSVYGQRKPHEIKEQPEDAAKKPSDVIEVMFVSDDTEGVRREIETRHRRRANYSEGRGAARTDRREGRSFGFTQSDVDFSAVDEPYQCPGDGFYADPHDCSIFYHCSNGKAFQHQCQPGTAFNQDKLVCSWPVGENGCGGMLSIPYKALVEEEQQQQQQPTSSTKRPAERSQRPTKTTSSRVTSPAPTTARRIVPRTTGPDTVSESLNRGSTTTTNRVTRDPGKTTQDTDVKTSSRSPQQSDSTPTRGPQAIEKTSGRAPQNEDTTSSPPLEKVPVLNFRCPDDVEAFYPDPRDCKVFYHCANGQPFRHLCGNGTAFNSDNSVCSWPLNSDTGCGSVLYKADLSLLRVAFRGPKSDDGVEEETGSAATAKPRLVNLTAGDGAALSSEASRERDSPVRHNGYGHQDDYHPGGSQEQHGISHRNQKHRPHHDAHHHSRRKREVLGTTIKSDETPMQKVVTGMDKAFQQHRQSSDEDKGEKPSANISSTAFPNTMPSKSSSSSLSSPSSSLSSSTSSTTTVARSDRKAEYSILKNSVSEPAQPYQVESSNTMKPNDSDGLDNSSTASTRVNANASSSSTQGEPHIPGVIDSKQRSSSWPWESVERKHDKEGGGQRREASLTSAKTNDSVTGNVTTPDSTTPSIDVKASITTTRTTSKPETLRELRPRLDDADNKSSLKSSLDTSPSSLSPSPATETPVTMSSLTTKRGTDSQTTNTATSVWNPITEEKTYRDLVKAETYRVQSQLDDFRCPLPAGHFRDPTNCAVYYHCLNKVAYRKNCPNGELFDLKQHRCLPISRVTDCRRVEDKSMDLWSLYPGMNKLPNKAGKQNSFECKVLNGFSKNEQDCTAYIECINGLPYPRQCMSGTVFDASRQKCTWNSLVSECRMAAANSDSADIADSVGTDFQCPNPDGYYGDPESCSFYFHCIDGRAMGRKCDPNNFFDPQASTCRWDKLVADCDPAGIPIPRDRLPLSNFVCPLPNGHYRDPNDCRVFYHCLNDIPYRGNCRIHHAFDVNTMTCVSRQRVEGCGGSGGASWSDDSHLRDEGERTKTKKPPLADHPASTTIRQQQYDGGNKGKHLEDSNKGKQPQEGSVKGKQSEDAPTFQCPKPVGAFRDTENCQVYYRCFSGLPFKHMCQDGTIFSERRGLCTWPLLVPECQLVPQGEAEVTQGKAEVTSHKPAGPEERTKEWDAITQSQAEPQSHLKIGPHADLQDVPHGHLLDAPQPPPYAPQSPPYAPAYAPQLPPYAREHVIPSVVHKDSGLRLGRTSEGETSDTDVNEGGADVIMGPSVVKVGIVDVNKGPVDLTKSNDVDRGSHSVFQHDSGPDRGNTVSETEAFDYDQGEVHRPDPSTDGVNRFVLEAPLPLSEARLTNSVVDFYCPEMIFDQYFRDPRDCTKFHRCVKGTRFSFHCPRGTFFEPLHTVCDFQDNVPDCDHEGRRVGSEARETLGTPIQFPWRESKEKGEAMSEPAPDNLPSSSDLCPQSDGLFAHPSSCRKFVYCSRGIPTVLTCPADLLYNVETMTCDYDENIVCVRYDK